MVNYNNVAKTVEPKRKKVADSEKNLRMAQKDLIKTKDEVQRLNTQLTVTVVFKIQMQFAFIRNYASNSRRRLSNRGSSNARRI